MGTVTQLETKAYFGSQQYFCNGTATQFATVPLGPLPKDMDAAEAAAWTVVSSVLLNLDEMFMKR